MDLNVEAVVDAILGRDLAPQSALPAEPLPERSWAHLAGLAEGGRLWGEVAAAIADGDLAATEEQAAAAHDRHLAAMGTVLELEAVAASVLECLESAGLRARVLKGLATAHLDHPDPSHRSFGDVDLLVEPRRFRDTIMALQAAGWRRDLPERRPRYDERFGKDATLRRATWVEIDLHRTLVNGAFGLWIDLDELWAGSTTIEICGRPAEALDGPRRLLHACYAAVLGDTHPRRGLLRDIALLAARRPDRVASAYSLAAAWHGTLVIEAALAITEQRLGLPAHPRSALVPPGAGAWPERMAMRSYRSQGGSNTKLRLAGTLALPTWMQRASYLGALVAPDQSYRRARRQAGRDNEWRLGVLELASPSRRNGRATGAATLSRRR